MDDQQQGPPPPADLVLELSSYGYHVQRVIGRGRYGMVVAASSADTGCCAIKLIPRGASIESTYMQREITNHATMKHPFIIQLKLAFLSPQYLCLVMELGSMDLAQFCESQAGGRLAEDTARHLMRQMLVGLDYMHRLGISNRDLKLENVLLTYQDQNIVAKLSDFGYSKDRNKHSTARSGVGTVGYTAPEVIIGGIAYDADATDIWSLGVMLYVMIAGRFPFDVQSKSCSQDIVQGSFRPPEDGLNLSQGLLRLLRRMLEPSPRKRATIAEIMQHEWVVDKLGGYRLETGSAYGERLELGPSVERNIEELVRRAAQQKEHDKNEGALVCVFNNEPE